MPELPEVETIARQLKPRMRGCELTRLQILDPKLYPKRKPNVKGLTVDEVRRAGKQLVVGLKAASGKQGKADSPGQKKSLWLTFHLRMTGNLIWAKNGSPIEPRHLRARLTFDRGSLLFYDTRRFGVLQMGPELGPMLQKGLEPLSPEFTPARLSQLLMGCKQAIKPWLLRQDRLVGLGNYLAAEILFRAQIRPNRQARRLNSAEIERLHAAIREITKRAIDNCGTTFSDYRDASGENGSFQNFLKVYGRGGEPCRECGQEIRRILQQQRSTFFCPGCQSAKAQTSSGKMAGRRPVAAKSQRLRHRKAGRKASA